MLRWLFPPTFAMVIALCYPVPVSAQEPTPAPPPTDTQAISRGQEVGATPIARPEDVASADAILAALYDVISGPAGQRRDWDRFRSLFIPGARLIPTGRRPDGGTAHRVLTPEEYISRSGRVLEERGFFEREIGRTSDQFGALMHVFSSYDSRRRSDDAEPFARGINSIQLLNDGSRWWVVTVFWDSERPDLPIPERYLSK